MQELPAIFCDKCGSPLLRISKIFLTLFLSITVAVFVLFGVMQGRGALLWPAPLYGYFCLLFVLYSFAVTRRHHVITVRMLAWSSILAYAMWFFWLSWKKGIELFTSDVRDVLDLIEREPVAMWVTLGVLVVVAIIGFVVLMRRFGYMMGYRIYFTLLAVAALVARFLFSYSVGEIGHVSPRLSDWFAWAPETEVKELFELIGVNVLRAIVAEMAVFSFVKAYKPAAEHFQKIQSLSAARRGKEKGASLALVDATARLTTAILRSAILLKFFFLTFFHTFSGYMFALWRTLRRITVDLLIPAGSMILVAWLTSMLSEHTAAYITGKPSKQLLFWVGVKSSPIMILTIIIMLFLVQMIFLGAITKFPLRSLMRCNSLLILWIAPFFFAFFVFISLSLIATGTVLRRGDGVFPYHFGPFTLGAIVMLVIMVAFAIWHGRKTRFDDDEEEEAEVAAMGREAVADAVVSPAELHTEKPDAVSSDGLGPVPPGEKADNSAGDADKP